jgi:hypothetical protein
LTGRRSRLLLNDALDIGDRLVEDLLQDLGVLELLVDLGDNALGQFALLALLNLSFVAYPAVEHVFGLSGQGGALLELESLRLDLGGFLRDISCWVSASVSADAYLGDLEEVLRDLNDIGERLHVLDASAHSLGVTLPRVIQSALDAGDCAVGPLAVHGTTVFEDTVEDGEQAESNDGFLVEHVQLIGDSPGGNTGTGRQDRGLGNEAVAWESIDD